MEAASLLSIIAYVVFTVATARRAGEMKVDFPVEQLIPER